MHASTGRSVVIISGLLTLLVLGGGAVALGFHNGWLRTGAGAPTPDAVISDRVAPAAVESPAVDPTEAATQDEAAIYRGSRTERGLFQPCVDHLAPIYRNQLFIRQFPGLFPADSAGNPTADHIPRLVDMFFDPSLVPEGPSVRGLGPTPEAGQRKYMLNRYFRERGDRNITSVTDLIEKSKFFTDIRPDAGFVDRKAILRETDAAMTLDMANIFETRYATRVMVFQCMALENLDAAAFPTGNTPAEILGAPREPTVNGRDISAWGVLGQDGFPTMSVPAGFTTHVFDRVRDEAAPGGTRLVGPVPARLPVGLAFLARPFDEGMLLRIASAYERATRHRVPPPEFGLLPREP